MQFARFGINIWGCLLSRLSIQQSITAWFRWDIRLALTPSPPFSFLAYLLGKGGVKKWGFPLGFEPGTPRTTMHCSPMARHPGVAARAAILFPYETRFYDVIGLSAFSSLPLVGLVRVKGEEVLCIVNPNSLAPFFVSSLSPRKGRGQKMGVPPGFRTGDPPHHNALFTHGTPPGCRCPDSDFVPIWDPLLWRNRT